MTRIVHWYASLDMAEFAGRLKLLREARHLTQARLAELLSIDPYWPKSKPLERTARHRSSSKSRVGWRSHSSQRRDTFITKRNT